MDVLSVLGSPRRAGNTARVLDWVEEALHKAGSAVERIRVGDRDIRPCTGCFACKLQPGSLCIQRDDANDLFRQMRSADVVLMATPIYCFGFPSPLKALIDRSVCLVSEFGTPGHASLIEGRRIGLVATAEGPIERNLDLLIQPFELLCDYWRATSAGHLLIPGCTTPESMGEDVRSQARAYARALLGR